MDVLTVLVADDEFAVLEVLSIALESEGFVVLKAGDGADALRILAGHRCDLVVVDELMPVLNGYQLIEAMRAEPRFATLPIIMMADTWGRPRPEIEGVVVLDKPILLADLFARIEELARPAAKG